MLGLYLLGTLTALGMALLFFLSNLSLQYGAGRLPANVTAIIMLTEVPVAALSALWLGGAAAALGAYVLTSGQFFEIVEVEEDDDLFKDTTEEDL